MHFQLRLLKQGKTIHRSKILDKYGQRRTDKQKIIPTIIQTNIQTEKRTEKKETLKYDTKLILSEDYI